MPNSPNTFSLAAIFLKTVKLAGIAFGIFFAIAVLLNERQNNQFNEVPRGNSVEIYHLFGRLRERTNGISTNDTLVLTCHWVRPDGADPIPVFNAGDSNLLIRICARSTDGTAFERIECHVPASLVSPLLPIELAETLGNVGYQPGGNLPPTQKTAIRSPSSASLGHRLLDVRTFSLDAFWLSYNDRYFRLQDWGAGSQQGSNCDFVYSVEQTPTGRKVAIHRYSVRWFNSD